MDTGRVLQISAFILFGNICADMLFFNRMATDLKSNGPFVSGIYISLSGKHYSG
jgi:hypothetical protein